MIALQDTMHKVLQRITVSQMAILDAMCRSVAGIVRPWLIRSGLQHFRRARDTVHADEHSSVVRKSVGSLRQDREEGWICGDKLWVYVSPGA